MLTLVYPQLQLAPSFLHSPPFTSASCLSWYSPAQASTRCRTDYNSAGKRWRCKCGTSYSSNQERFEKEDEEDFQVLVAIQSLYNHIVILDSPSSRLLLLDTTGTIHSILNKGSKWTNSYWDEFATLPPIVPTGPIAIFGMGGGTAAHLMLELWPSLQLEGWEIDEILIDMSRDYLGLSDLEKHNSDGGILNIHIGDVFSPSVGITGGYSGIIVDLFANGKVLPQLEEASTWLDLYGKLAPTGRIMVNCGAGQNELPSIITTMSHGDGSNTDGTWELNATIKALCKAFPGQVNWKKMSGKAGENYLALTGPLLDLDVWSACIPSELSSIVYQWKICNNSGI
ncbi:hypothetical protein F511_42746 [Dorcoceras hygrometricum]|uniref:S-adenosyl-L-methionine-dependent methyltransferases superfamily protein n=1 Tax=Dorcoceras hygrometricum TaxID=472368 RepID=A0A2Z7C2T9_9LAMI|nr:hypothetical protein F511_42746 [Dorcoceras hygrometricum]